MALKKKKLYEDQLNQIENNILRVNEQQMGLENLRTTVETVDALRTGAHASKATMKEMKIDDVDRVLDEINDQTEQMQQIQQAMGQPIGAAADIDDDELLGEFEVGGCAGLAGWLAWRMAGWLAWRAVDMLSVRREQWAGGGGTLGRDYSGRGQSFRRLRCNAVCAQPLWLHQLKFCKSPIWPLQEMAAAQLDEKLIDAASVPGHRIPAQAAPEAALPAMPNAPTTRPQPAAPAKTAEELELEQLQADMAM